MNIFKRISLGLFALLFVWGMGFCVFAFTSLTRSAQALDQTSDAVVVLTGGKTRISSALDLFASGRAPHLFISGVHKDVKRSELLAQWQGNGSLPPCCIELGYEATTTVQNAEETYGWLRDKDFHSIRLVTGNYHMNRALMELQHTLPGIEIYPHPVQEPDLSPKNQHFWELLFSEYHKTLYRSLNLTFTMRPASLVEG